MSTIVSFLISIVLGTGLALLAWWRQGTVEWFIFTVFSCMFVWGLLIQLCTLRAVKVTRHIQGPLYAGDSIDVTVHITMRSWLPLAWLVLHDQVTQIGAGADSSSLRLFDQGMGITSRLIARHSKFIIPGTRQEFTYQYRLRGLGRGSYHFPQLQLRTGDIFGWFTKTRTVRTADPLLVYPAQVPWTLSSVSYFVPHVACEQQDWRVIDAVQPGTELREYQPGDPWRRIHWKASARLGRFQLRLPEQEGEQAAALILDSLSGQTARWESVVAWGCARLHQLVQNGVIVSFVGWEAGTQVQHTVQRTVSHAVMRYFAEVQMAAERPLLPSIQKHAMTHAEGSTFMLVSERIDLETAEIAHWLTTRRYRFELIWFMPQNTLSPDQQKAIERVQRMGGQVICIEPHRVQLAPLVGGVEDVSA